MNDKLIHKILIILIILKIRFPLLKCSFSFTFLSESAVFLFLSMTQIVIDFTKLWLGAFLDNDSQVTVELYPGTISILPIYCTSHCKLLLYDFVLNSYILYDYYNHLKFLLMYVCPSTDLSANSPTQDMVLVASWFRRIPPSPLWRHDASFLLYYITHQHSVAPKLPYVYLDYTFYINSISIMLY